MSTLPSVPMGTVMRLGRASASPRELARSSTLRFDATGSGVPCGNTVQNPVAAGPTTVTFRTAARALAAVGRGASPTTRTVTVPPAPTALPDSRVSSRRCGTESGTNTVVSPGAACARGVATPTAMTATIAVAHEPINVVNRCTVRTPRSVTTRQRRVDAPSTHRTGGDAPEWRP